MTEEWDDLTAVEVVEEQLDALAYRLDAIDLRLVAIADQLEQLLDDLDVEDEPGGVPAWHE